MWCCGLMSEIGPLGLGLLSFDLKVSSQGPPSTVSGDHRIVGHSLLWVGTGRWSGNLGAVKVLGKLVVS